MQWLHGLKARHEQQNTPNYLKKKESFSKSSNISGVLEKSCVEENQYCNDITRVLNLNVRKMKTTIF